MCPGGEEEREAAGFYRLSKRRAEEMATARGARASRAEEKKDGRRLGYRGGAVESPPGVVVVVS